METINVRECCRRQFEALWQETRMTGRADLAFQYLAERYAERHRKYHTISHIAAGFQILKWARAYAEDPIALGCAWAYHDIKYDIPGPENEEKSARLARLVCADNGLHELGNRVYTYIIATKHDAKPASRDGQLIADVDLAPSFGASWEQFKHDTQCIQEEYVPTVPIDLFLAKNSELLAGFLKREHIFYLEPFRERFEAQARANIERLLAERKAALS
jgi:predicted metal-dependent HD superfamily phosphohydrolase